MSWLLLVSALMASGPTEAVVRLDWSGEDCPTKRRLAQALKTYDIRVDDAATIVVTGRILSERLVRLELERSVREVKVPKGCADRAAVIAVVIDALVAPFFWPMGKPRAAASQPSFTALDFLKPSSQPASAPSSEPASLPVVARAPATQPASSAATSQPARQSALGFATWLLGGVELWSGEPVRGRVGVGFGITWPWRVRWLIELGFVTPHTLAFGAGSVAYGEGLIGLGADISVLAGWYAGALLGAQLVYARASGFDLNRDAWLVGPSAELRTGYRHVFRDRFELGARVAWRADLFRQRLLIDDSVAGTLSPFHIAVVVTCGVVW